MRLISSIKHFWVIVNMAFLMVFGSVAATAQDSDLALQQLTLDEDPASIWLSYGPKGTAPFSFWFEGQNGIIAHWTLPEGFSLGTLRLPKLQERGDRQAPTFVFESGARLLQEIIVAGGSITDITKIDLQLTYGDCADNCTQKTIGATVDMKRPAPLLVEGDMLPFRKRGIWARADTEMLNIGMHKNYNKDGRVDRAFFLPLDTSLSAAPAPMRLDAFKETGFFSNFVLKSPVEGDALIEGILVLDKPNAGGLEAYKVAPKNDFGRAGLMPEDSQIVQSDIPETSYGLAILLAIVGGLILNIMPCVFPVLALKLFSAIKSGSSDQAAVRKDATAYTLGVIASFVILAGILIAIRAAGIGAGWGYQLQSPAFVLVMALIFFTMGLNFLGAFEIPGFFSGAGQSLTAKKGAKGSFFTGVLATVVAAPCTAPFMVTAIAFALAKPPFMAISIFMALGLGLSLPYLLIGFVPASRRFFPKPGQWMVTFRTFLAFPMFATVVWMVWILSIQSGSSGVLLALAPMVLIAFAIWLSKILAGTAKALLVSLSVVALLFVIWEIKPLPKQMTKQPVQTASIGSQMIGDMEIIPFSREKLISLRQEGKNVFIHHWAAWCIICLMHENMVFSQDGFQTYLRENNIVFMMADRTNNDPELLAFMEKTYGRSSQPIDVFYSHNMAAKPIVLPTFFTTGKVTRIMGDTIARQTNVAQ